jgi:F-type H+-transporting ATPase subunit b
MIILALAESSIQLVPDGTLLLHLLLVVAMVAILDRTLFRPINKVLAEREAQTTGRVDEASKLQDDIEKALSQYERTLREARSSAYHFIEQERTEALKLREGEISQVREEIKSLVTHEKTEIERQVAAARAALETEALTTAVQIGSQILHRPIRNTEIPTDF